MHIPPCLWFSTENSAYPSACRPKIGCSTNNRGGLGRHDLSPESIIVPESTGLTGKPIGRGTKVVVKVSIVEAPPEPGQIALVRQRRYLIEGVESPTSDGEATLVNLSCLDDDAQGETLTVLWEHELDAQVLEGDGWLSVGGKGFDDPGLFAAYLRTLSWNCVTATDIDLFQAPFRAGIRIDAYQLEPLRKALRLPRVNLFIADDVGLGKTIEAGLVARELLLRRRVNRIVVACPPSMLEQWRDELQSRFGLSFSILDREYLTRVRRERGFAVNPWTTHSYFLVSHRLLVDESYASGLRDWLGEFAPKSLLILDEAHNAAPAGGARYAIDSQITRAVRDIAPRFEHRLFLSATPHNGHSNSFSALLEILDPQRFCRGVRVQKGQLEEIMIRRLKSDIRELEGGFPRRNVVQIDIDGLPTDSPELLLATKLDGYRTLRDKRLKDESRSRQTAAALVMGGLQKRLLSSVDAFARTLAVHRRSVDLSLRQASVADEASQSVLSELQRLTLNDNDNGIVAERDDGERGQDEGTDLRVLEDRPDPEELELDELMIIGTTTSSDSRQASQRVALEEELALVDEMIGIAEAGRYQQDPRIKKIIEWMDKQMCPGLLDTRRASPQWNDRRVIIFTEYEDTRRYIERCLTETISNTSRATERIATFTGNTSRQRREEIKDAFNGEPADYPLRVLIATDAAREGLNLQRHCCDLFHFDLPWNPGRLDQRNGRIDRKLQPSDEVFCHYFVYQQRPEDRVLEVLVKKAERIREEMGSVAKVLEARIAESIGREGMRRDCLNELSDYIQSAEEGNRRGVVEDELEEARSRQEKLKGEIDDLRTSLERSRLRIGITPTQFRQTLSMSLQLAGAPGITPNVPSVEPQIDTPHIYYFPADSDVLVRDSGWTAVLDSLRRRRQRGENIGEWRQRAPARPVVFEDSGRLGDNAVHLHLEHRVAQRLLGRFTAQGLIHHDLSKACLAATSDAVPRVILLGRLSVYGPRAARLHEEIITVAARWTDPTQRSGPLTPYSRATEQVALNSLQAALDDAGQHSIPEEVQKRFAASTEANVADLLPHLHSRGGILLSQAVERLSRRADTEKRSMIELLESQRRRIQEANASGGLQLTLGFDPEELRQYEADRNAWTRRLKAIESELESEPRRIAESYVVQAHRIDPLGLVYLWPRTG